MNKKRVIAYGIVLIVVIIFSFVGGMIYSQQSGVTLPDVPGLFIGKSFSGYIVSVKEKEPEAAADVKDGEPADADKTDDDKADTDKADVKKDEKKDEGIRELEIKTVEGNLEKFILNKGTRIVLPDKKLEIGKFVTVKYKDTNTGKIAKIIRAVKNPPKPEDKKDADVKDADVKDADVKDADVKDADVKDADKKDADKKDADVKDADKKDADVKDADKKDADVKDADKKDKTE